MFSLFLAQPFALFIDTRHERRKGFGERCDTLVLEFLGDRREIDAQGAQLRQPLSRAGDIVGDRRHGLPMIEYGIECGRRQRVHCIRANQVVHIERVGVVGTFDTSAGPEWPLHPRTLRTRLPIGQS